MIRQTSIDAYRKIRDEGLLSERRWQVYEILFEQGPMTGSQMAIAFRKKYSMIAPNQANMVTRLGELRDQRVVKELDPIECPITGQRVILWDVTAKLPVELKKPKKIKCKHCNGRGFFLQEKLL